MPEKVELVDYQRFANEWRKNLHLYRTENMKTAEYLNIFRILNVSHLETKLHTPFLKELLDSDGSHGQGTLFFHALLQQMPGQPGGVQHENVLSYADSPFDDEYSCRAEEFNKEAGQMDIVINRWSGRRAFCIVIENKISAGEQEEQLSRYSREYLQKRHVPPERRHLVYLHAKSEDHKPKSGGNTPVVILRYQDHIKRMLVQCLPQIRSEVVKELIKQYIAIIEEL
jgi:hypothetical protein